MRLSLAFLAAVLASAALWAMAIGAQQPSTTSTHEWPEHPDGYWWRGLKGMDKIRFIQGFTTAMGTPLYVSTAGLKPDCAKLINSLEESNFKFHDFTGATVGQYEEGLDEFYSDYANKLIVVQNAIFYVRNKATGKSQSDLEK